jgi:septum formation protein
MALRLVLASQSPARLATLRSAGLEPEVVVSGVDESQLAEKDPAALAVALAGLKAGAVADRLETTNEAVLVVGCDSVLELDGEVHGKPSSPAEAVHRWRRMRGRSGVLHTGHCLVELTAARARRQLSREARTVVHFAELTDAEIAAYVATEEPLRVAGAFTLDGLGGAYVTGIEGDPHTVVGIGLPLLRNMVRELGHEWHALWRR